MTLRRFFGKYSQKKFWLSFIEDRVDHSDSPLTDMTVLFGGAGRLANFLEYFDRWLAKEETQTFWESLAWVRNKL